MKSDNEEKLIEQMNNDELTYVEYIEQCDEDLRNEYEDYCKKHGLDPKAEESAMAFIDFTEDELEANSEL